MILHLTAGRNSITAFWKVDRPLKFSSFSVFVDGEFYKRTTDSFCTISDLKPKKEYKVSVYAISDVDEYDVPIESMTEYDEKTVTTLQEKRRVDVTKMPYFAVTDGLTLTTEAIQEALNELSEDEYLYFPKGTYLTGALDVKSGTEIVLDKEATIQGSVYPEDYLPKVLSRFEGTELETYRSLLNMGELDHKNYGFSASDIYIHGEGTISGGGKELAENIIHTERENYREYLQSLPEGVKVKFEKADTLPGRQRGRLIQMKNCKNVRLSGLTLKNGPAWNVHFIYSDTIITDHCTIISEDVWNGDGWDPDSSENCFLFDTVFTTSDDAVAIKSGKNPEGNVINRKTKNVWIFQCKSVLQGGSIAIGSEMSGGVEEVYIWDCDFASTKGMIYVKGTKDRGGYVKHLHTMNCKVDKICFLSDVNYNNDGEPAKDVPKFSDCSFYQMTINEGIEIGGFDKPGHETENISFRHIRFLSKEKQKLSMHHCKNIILEDISTKENVE